jgi:hypothetical protein
MADREQILSIRPPERSSPRVAASDPHAVPDHGTPSTPRTTDPPRQPDVVPLAQHRGLRPYAWRDLSDQQPLTPVQIRLGSTRCCPGDAPSSAVGTIVVLDQSVNDPVQIVVSGVVVGHGRLVIAKDKLAVEVTQVRGKQPRKSA